MPPVITHRYFHFETGWDEQAEGAELRLDASVVEHRKVEARNVLYSRDQKGDWRPVSDESALDGQHRGLIWETWKTAVDGDEYLAFRGVRAVDENLAEEFLKGLALRDEEGVILTESRQAGRIFLLDNETALEFAKRIKDAGGVVSWGLSLPEGIGTHLTRIKTIADLIEAERVQDQEIVAEAESGNFSGIASFERRTKGFLTLASESADLYMSCRRALRQLLSQGKTPGEREQAASTLAQARQARDAVVVAREERDEDAAELARLAGIDAGRVEPSKAPALRLAAATVARGARRAGYKTEERDGEIIIRLPSGTLKLGEGFTYEERAAKPHQPQAKP
jgi:hypothetical protein